MTMPTIRLGGDGPEISRIGLGAMPLSLANRPPRDAAKEVVRRAVELGVTLIDTADVYCLDDTDIGHNELLIAEALREIGAGFGGLSGTSNIVLATKGGMIRPGGRWERDGRPERIRAACEASLRRLGVEVIDLYQFHAPDAAVPFVDSVGALGRLREEGKVRSVGLSNVTVGQLDEARALVPISSVQNRLVPWDLGGGPIPILNACELLGITFLPYGPLGGSSRVSRVIEHPPLVRAAAVAGCAPAELVLAYLMHLSPVIVPIPGASRLSSLESSVRATAVEMPEERAAQLRRAFRSLPGAPSALRRLAGAVKRRLSD